MQKYLSQYLADRDIDNFYNNIKTLTPKEQTLCLAVIGGEYIQKNDFTKAEQYLKESVNIDMNKINTYNLGYLCEKLNKEDEMIQYYSIAHNLGSFEACNQLGAYFINKPEIPFIGNTPEWYLLLAANNGIVPAYNNLIKLYQDDYDKKINIMIKKYTITKDISVLMDAMLQMLNKGDYYRYVSLSKLYNISMNGKENLLSLLKPYEDTCPVCLDSSSECVKTLCGHTMCAGCMHSIIVQNPKCPLCRESLFIMS